MISSRFDIKKYRKKYSRALVQSNFLEIMELREYKIFLFLMCSVALILM